MTVKPHTPRNIFDYSVYEAILYGACGPAAPEPVALDSENPVTNPHTKGCCGGTNPACHGCDRCGPKEPTEHK